MRSVLRGTRSSSTTSSETAQPSRVRVRPETDSTAWPVSSSKFSFAAATAFGPDTRLVRPLPPEFPPAAFPPEEDSPADPFGRGRVPLSRLVSVESRMNRLLDGELQLSSLPQRRVANRWWRG